jgi:DNA polymerase zeta
MDMYPTEEALLRAWAARVRRIDPDVLVGYEIQRASWGYLVDRAAHAYRTPASRFATTHRASG